MIALWAKLKGWAALLGVGLLALGVAFLRGRSEGKKIIEAEQQKRRDQLQEHYDEIDRSPIDPPAAYNRLRDRSKGVR